MDAALARLIGSRIGPFSDCGSPWIPGFEPELPASGEVLVVLADSRELAAWPESLQDAIQGAAWLGPEQRIRLARLRSEQAKSHFVVRHTLLRHFCSTLRGCPPEALHFESSGTGKPHLAGRQLEFSISGRGSWCLLAFDPDAPVGADLEIRRCAPDIRQIAGWIFPPGELSCLDEFDTEECRSFVFDAWTLEEAAAKREGVGIAQSLRPENREARLARRAEETSIHRLRAPRVDEALHLAVASANGGSRTLRLCRFRSEDAPA